MIDLEKEGISCEAMVLLLRKECGHADLAEIQNENFWSFQNYIFDHLFV